MGCFTARGVHGRPQGALNCHVQPSAGLDDVEGDCFMGRVLLSWIQGM